MWIRAELCDVRNIDMSSHARLAHVCANRARFELVRRVCLSLSICRAWADDICRRVSGLIIFWHDMPRIDGCRSGLRSKNAGCFAPRDLMGFRFCRTAEPLNDTRHASVCVSSLDRTTRQVHLHYCVPRLAPTAIARLSELEAIAVV